MRSVTNEPLFWIQTGFKGAMLTLKNLNFEQGAAGAKTEKHFANYFTVAMRPRFAREVRMQLWKPHIAR